MIEAGAAGRPLRGPGGQREEVRPPRRQGAGPHRDLRPHPHLGPAGRRRHGRPHRAGGAHRRRERQADHERRRPLRRALHREGRADQRGVPPAARRHRVRHPPRPGLRPLRRPGLVRDRHARPPRGQALRRGHPREVPGQAAGLQLLALLQLEEEPRRRHHRQVPARAGGHGLQVPVRHPGRLPRPQPRHVRAGPRLQGVRDGGLHRAAGGRVRLGGGRLHRHPPPARGRHRLLRPGGHRGLGRRRPRRWRWSTRPRRRSSPTRDRPAPSAPPSQAARGPSRPLRARRAGRSGAGADRPSSPRVIRPVAPTARRSPVRGVSIGGAAPPAP